MTEEEVFVHPDYVYMFEYRDREKTNGIVYPIQFGFECGKGWDSLLIELIQKLAEADHEKQLRVFQIKQKFGELRFYVENSNKRLDEIIDEYEVKIASTCEFCGKSGSLRTDLGWLRPLCEECYEKAKETD